MTADASAAPTGRPPVRAVAGRPRGRPRKDADPAPADDVLAAALHAFAIHGYQGVSVRTLNRELGVSHNLLHQRFGSKEAIWYAAVDWGFGGLVEQLARADDDRADPLDRLRVFIRTFVAFNARHPDLVRVANAEGGQPTERLDYLLDNYVRPTIERTSPIVEQLVAAGRLKDVSRAAIYFLVTSGAGAMYSNDAMTRALFSADVLALERVDEYADGVATIILDGLTR
ncbi:MAG TPA: TetR/AcrR family transcriptional regulator [Pseudonocardia sp.]|nr:TetR/AcrR family transcriptional regulator [Pseudonocardia sp.]